MARRRSKGLGLGLDNDKILIYMLYAIIFLAVLQHIEVFIGFAALIAVFAIPCYWLRWHAKNEEKQKLLQAGLDEIDRMDGVQFEQYLGALFEGNGYKVEYTPASGDYGADLLLRKGNHSIAVQAKRYSNAVGVKAVQEASGAKGYYGTHEAWVITNNAFTKNACNCANRLNVKLIDRSDLINLISESKTAVKPQEETRPI